MDDTEKLIATGLAAAGDAPSITTPDNNHNANPRIRRRYTQAGKADP